MQKYCNEAMCDEGVRIHMQALLRERIQTGWGQYQQTVINKARQKSTPGYRRRSEQAENEQDEKNRQGSMTRPDETRLRLRVNPISLSYPFPLVLRVHVRVRAIPILILIEG